MIACVSQCNLRIATACPYLSIEAARSSCARFELMVTSVASLMSPRLRPTKRERPEDGGVQWHEKFNAFECLGCGEFAEIRVTDTGTGIPEAIRGRIFDPFFTTKQVGKGTGQGLSIAHSVIVEKHSGSIRIETEVGVGTTFIIRLPLHHVSNEANS